MEERRRPSLSVVVATVQGWPEARPTVEALRREVEALEGEVVVVDGGPEPPPSADQLGPAVRWLRRPGESVFQLRRAGYREAAGEIVAVTEDHCLPLDGWANAILRAHAEHPEAIAVGGVVRNGTTIHAIDWAAYIVTQAPFAPPMPHGEVDRVVGAPAVSYKRGAIERLPDHRELGAIELFDTAGIRRDGETLVSDPRIGVLHHQSMGLSGTAAAEFHNGRSVAAFRRQRFGVADLLRVIAFPLLPIFRSSRSLRIAFQKEIPRPSLVSAAPFVVFLHYCQAAGEVMGYLAGPGDSPRRLH
jgi:hypothetical protein